MGLSSPVEAAGHALIGRQASPRLGPGRSQRQWAMVTAAVALRMLYKPGAPTSKGPAVTPRKLTQKAEPSRPPVTESMRTSPLAGPVGEHHPATGGCAGEVRGQRPGAAVIRAAHSGAGGGGGERAEGGSQGGLVPVVIEVIRPRCW